MAAAAAITVFVVGALALAAWRGGDWAEDVDFDRVIEHLARLQAIADANGGNRADGEPGMRASVDYVVEVLEAAGYRPDVQEFTFDQLRTRAELEWSGSEQSYEEHRDFRGLSPLDWSAGGEASEAKGTVIGVDLTIPPAESPSSTSGCERRDFADFPAGSIALIQRAICSPVDQVRNAEYAGASGVILMSEGQPGLRELYPYGNETESGIPAISVTYEVGAALAAEGPEVGMSTEATIVELTSWNVLAQTPGDSARVVMAGAHLDSVRAGPGINDNGSGSAALLALAEELADAKLANPVRFAWWGAEELGLVGSGHYVSRLSEPERAEIAAYLNVDMIGSPNHYFGVYDGDGSIRDGIGGPVGFAIPGGSAQIEALFAGYFDERGIVYQDVVLGLASDHLRFMEVGIPVGGLFTGYLWEKSAAEVEASGGVVGVPHDPCYHQACDSLTGGPDWVAGLDVTGNISMFALETNTRALAFVVTRLADDLSLLAAGLE
jgi:Zn-dependent M28 family amino/carboxypeptidase